MFTYTAAGTARPKKNNKTQQNPIKPKKTHPGWACLKIPGFF